MIAPRANLEEGRPRRTIRARAAVWSASGISNRWSARPLPRPP